MIVFFENEAEIFMENKQQEIFNIILKYYCPDDMETRESLVSFDVDTNVFDAKEAFKEAVSEYVLAHNTKAPVDEDEEVETLTWGKIFSSMTEEDFMKHGLRRRKVMVNNIMTLDCDDEPDIDEW